jgi:hypothetical protein
MISHGCYAIKIIVCNETFLASSAHSQDFKWDSILVVNNTSLVMVLRNIHRLIIIFLKMPM